MHLFKNSDKLDLMRKKRLIYILAVILISAVFFNSCATTRANTDNRFTSEPQKPKKGEAPAEIQEKLKSSAAYYLGTTSGMLEADGRSYCLDCSGALLAIYYRAGIDLEKCYTGYEGNGVKRLYSCLRDHELIYLKEIPEVGDLIFWDNTWDRNEDGQFNDYFTHAGMVVDVDSEGTITYAHHNYRKGIIYEKMNLLHPHDPALNSAMRMRGSPPAPNGQYLSGELIRVFGRAWMLPESYWR